MTHGRAFRISAPWAGSRLTQHTSSRRGGRPATHAPYDRSRRCRENCRSEPVLFSSFSAEPPHCNHSSERGVKTDLPSPGRLLHAFSIRSLRHLMNCERGSPFSTERKTGSVRRHIRLHAERFQVSGIHAALFEADILEQFVESPVDGLLRRTGLKALFDVPCAAGKP